MAKKAYIGIDGIARKINRGYVGVDGVARRIVKAYVGVGGVARPCWSTGLEYYGTITQLGVARRGIGGAGVGNYAMFAGGSLVSVSYYTNVEAYKSMVKYDAPALSRGRYDTLGITNYEDRNYAMFAGGNDARGSNSGSLAAGNTVDVYDSSLTQKTDVEPLYQGRYGMSGGCVKGVFIAGGGMGPGTHTFYERADVYDKSLTKLDIRAEMEMRSFRGAGVSNDYYVVITGGESTSGSPHNRISAIDSSGTLRASEPAKLKTAKYFHGGARAGKNIIFAGGRGKDNVYSDVDAYDSSLTKIDGVASLSVARYHMASETLDKYAMFIGGQDNNSIYATIDVYDDSLTRIEEPVLALGVPRFNSAAAVAGSTLYVAGGQPASNSVSAEVDVYTN